ncbi:hypothetical protein HHK36_013785 [Tetracentron sinense]|uniref:Uncharacterized protein n=1 Tax=Tetracentron sinense TaxID=13715 RepID=A0A835DH30_TETSI|nr:hypothetical protein HHK36_013785 [Tetracentron sinense]
MNVAHGFGEEAIELNKGNQSSEVRVKFDYHLKVLEQLRGQSPVFSKGILFDHLGLGVMRRLCAMLPLGATIVAASGEWFEGEGIRSVEVKILDLGQN